MHIFIRILLQFLARKHILAWRPFGSHKPTKPVVAGTVYAFIAVPDRQPAFPGDGAALQPHRSRVTGFLVQVLDPSQIPNLPDLTNSTGKGDGGVMKTVSPMIPPDGVNPRWN
jgi:hypothetical protein